jgi:hypothetical protein
MPAYWLHAKLLADGQIMRSNVKSIHLVQVRGRAGSIFATFGTKVSSINHSLTEEVLRS